MEENEVVKGTGEGTVVDAAKEQPEAGKKEDAGKKEEAGKQAKPDLNALLASDKELQKQHDAQITKALDTHRQNWERQQNMTAEQLAAEKAKDKEAALAERERVLSERERRADALGMLSQKGLPVDLIDCVSLTDDEAMKASIEKAEKAYRKALEDGIKERLKGAPPKAGGAGAMDEFEKRIAKYRK